MKTGNKFIRNLSLWLGLSLGGAHIADAQLEVTAAAPIPASVAPGESIRFDVTITNSSETTASVATTVDMTVTLPSQSVGTIPLGVSSVTVPGLAAGDAYEFSITRTIPSSTTRAGSYFINLAFANETGPPVSNFATDATAVTVTGRPDFQITSLTYPANLTYEGGDIIPMAITYTNRRITGATGNTRYVDEAADNLRINIVLSGNPTYGDSDDFRLTFMDLGSSLNADGVDRRIVWDQKLPGNFSGSYYVLAKIDSLDEVDEVTEDDTLFAGNNIWLDVTAARIALEPTNFPSISRASRNGDNYSDLPTASEDGRYTVYASESTNLVTGDTNGNRDIFVYDNQTVTIRRLSESQQGAEGNGNSTSPFISFDSTSVVFSSEATNLVLGDTNAFSDIFKVATFTGAISRVNLASDGTQANGSSFRPSTSQDGQLVAFESTATNLATGGTTFGVTHIYLRNTSTGTTSLISKDSLGAAGNDDSTQARISSDGTFVVFSSDATNLVTGDSNSVRDVFVHEIASGVTSRVSVSTGGTEGNGSSQSASISQDGRHVAFTSQASNLVVDGNSVADVFTHDRNTATTTRVSVSNDMTESEDPSDPTFQLGSFNPSISATGRFVAFASVTTNLTDGDSIGQATAIEIATKGNGYTSIPTVAITGGGGSGATAVAVINTKVSVKNAEITNDGSGYTSVPTVTVNGSTTVLGATIDTSGNVSSLYVISEPTYTVAPTVVISAPAAGTTATAIVPVGIVTNIIVSNVGTGYTSAPTVTLSAGGGAGATATAEFKTGRIVKPDANRSLDIFVHDRDVLNTSTFDTASNVETSQVSRNRFGYQTIRVLGEPSTAASDIFPAISADGRWVVFPSDSSKSSGLEHGDTNLTSADQNGFRDVFIYDRKINALPNPSNDPTVSVTSPVNGASVAIGSTVAVVANATAPAGTVASVELFVDGSSLGAVTAAPFSVNWTPTVAGTYVLSAVVVDSFGNQGVSSNITVTVSTTSPGTPTVTVTSPSAGSVVPVNTATTLAATASDTDGTITTVEFFANGTSIQSVSAFPYNASWTPTVTGSISLTAVATDSGGNSTTSTAVVVTVSGGSAPAVSIASPVSGSSYVAGSIINVSATASAVSPATVASVAFFANGLPLVTDAVSPYNATWTPTSPGSYALRAEVTDTLGNIVSSSSTNITVVDNAPPAVTITSPGGGTSVSINTPTNITASASDSDGAVVGVEFFAGNVSLGTATGFPLSVVWTPNFPGSTTITARAEDDAGNITLSSGITVNVDAGGIPSSVILAPGSGTSHVVGNPIPITANATAVSPASIASVTFLANGILITTDTTAPFTTSWTPNSLGAFSLTTNVTDTLGNIGTSAPVSVTITDNNPPTVQLNQPNNGTTVAAGTPLTLGANAADSDGTVSAVAFFANGIQVGTDGAAPYSVSWSPTAVGAYQLTARATDNSGNVTESVSVTLNVGGNGAPVVQILSPSSGSAVSLGETFIIEATATDADGTIASVEFFASGVSLGSATEVPFRVEWKPTANGVYSLVATATDNGSVSSSSSEVIIAVIDPSSADAETFYSGSYLAGFEQGKFTMIRRGNVSTSFMARSNDGSGTYIYNDVPLNNAGAFSLIEGGVDKLTGQFVGGSVSGRFDGNRALMVGVTSDVSAGYDGATGMIHASIGDADDSSLLFAVAPNGELTVLGKSGSQYDLGFGTIDRNGQFSVATSSGGSITGTVDSVTGFLTANASGGLMSGQVTGAVSSAAVASDGFLRNLSTRGSVGSGDAVLVAGFVVNGTSTKQVLIRALGPTLGSAPINLSGAISDPTLAVFNAAGVQVAANDNWSSEPLAAATITAVGAFPLPSGSLDSAVVADLSPGPYTAQVSGVGGATGVGLVEIYDVDTLTAFSENKVLNVSTRGEVGSGEKTLIAGVIINGTTPKRVMIRAVGPTLANFGVSRVLADPVLELIRQDNGVSVRKNNNWEVGNNSAVVKDMALRVGAFALPAGSKDAVLLITLPPGIYTALVTSGDGSEGIALVEVYEVP